MYFAHMGLIPSKNIIIKISEDDLRFAQEKTHKRVYKYVGNVELLRMLPTTDPVYKFMSDCSPFC